ncbi:hypothetical protein CC1G_11730 [Coprinopsis cinerea okayama7|uniref:Uncharacterized protein n=1 Tax=Coprinopsis cinerea (strain Okayama-7 / 130 / ATCC MYA-4618 / FGSC 9003) TaxID=240176 RepID=A8NJY3_COPC7|nr:hypothetical protein CC1G_11730 [Coprinopsis cinerea okayama7\|eukprot:XP_001834321.2 hypothetical protein CC1G_11730 [Coprinopsis cinerea okayama7\
MAQHIWVESPITHDDITFIDNDQMETTDSPWDTSSTTAKPQPPPPTPHSSMMAAEWLVFNPNPGPQSAPWFSASEQDLFRNTEEVMDTFDVVLHRPVRPKLHINALPNEVLGEVFDLYTHSVESSYTPGRYGAVSVSRDKPNNPTILGRVCSRWRTLSHLTAKLWSKIAVISPFVKDVRILKHWLERSASRPLDITIVQRYPTRDMDIAIQSIFHLVLGENKRLRSISLDLCFNIERHLLCRTHIPLPRLTQFQLDLPACATVLQNAPWQRLHSVTLNDLEQANLPALFSVCENVQSLTIHRLEGPAGFPSPVCLPRLRELTLGYASDLSTIFNNLSLPALQTDSAISEGDDVYERGGSRWRSVVNDTFAFRSNSFAICVC